MNVGLIARADNRGLGVMTWEFARHLHPARILVVREPGAEARGFAPHLGRYPDATVVRFDAGLDEAVVREWLRGLDVVYSAETFYDDRFVDWARDAGVATVLHAMPEFCPPSRPQPDALWVPTTWRLDHLPLDTRVVPVPVATDRFAEVIENGHPHDGPLRVLHVAGHRAAADRNGTALVGRALPMMSGCHLTVIGQDGRLPAFTTRRRNGVSCTTRPGGVEHYWDLYRDQDVLVMPRRYGGLSLPVQEGMAAGLVPVMLDVAPNRDWPIVAVDAVEAGSIHTQSGDLRLAGCSPRELADALVRLAEDPVALRLAREAVERWVQSHAWVTLAPTYRAELARAADH